MNFFRMNKPRGYQHQYIYYDERKEKLSKIEEKAKRDLGMLPEEPYNPESIRGKFLESTTHLKRKKESGGAGMSPQVAVVLIVVLLLVLYYLVNGYWFGT